MNCLLVDEKISRRLYTYTHTEREKWLVTRGRVSSCSFRVRGAASPFYGKYSYTLIKYTLQYDIPCEQDEEET